MPNVKILTFDLETTELTADRGTLLCVGYKWLGEDEVHILSRRDYKGWNKSPQALMDDSKLWTDFLKVYRQADMLVTYFGKGFDSKFLMAKLLKQGHQVPDNIPHVDLFYIVKSNMALSRKSMDNVTRFLDLQDDDVHKSPVTFQDWQLASMGDEKALTYIEEHCYADILLTERLYMVLRPLVRQHPQVNGWMNCHACGSNHITHQGSKMTITKGKRVKMQCRDCGAWHTFSATDAEKING